MDNKTEKNKALFIKTKDFETSEILKNEGFELIDYTNETWTFMNNANRSLMFNDNKIVYSNILCF